MTRIVLDADAFKALASDTRLEILKALDVRRLTVSELGRLLELNKATVFEHLKQLQGAQLVNKLDEGRKWVYYKLTWKGRNVLHPENAQIFLMLGAAALSLGGAVAALGRVAGWWLADPLPSGSPDGSGGETPRSDQGAQQGPAPSGPEQDDAQDPNATAPPETEPVLEAEPAAWWADWGPWTMIALALVVVAAGLWAWHQYRIRLAERRDISRRLAVIRPAADLAGSGL